MHAAILLAQLTLFMGLTQTGSGDSTRVVGRVGSQSHPAAHAVVIATSDSDVRTTIADARGHYAFLTLLPGVYRLTACQPLPPAQILQPHAAGAAESFLELSAGIEYLANLSPEPCVWR